MNVSNCLAVLLLLIAVTAITADVYMHNPRGSNNRLNGNGVNRANANRLFDSQNNGKGGYCWGPQMKYFVGSMLSIEWTNQHGCGGPNTDCNIVLQYMCGNKDEVRDGATTGRIENNLDTYNQLEAQTPEEIAAGEEPKYTYGMHEDIYYYRRCQTRERNLGLFIADREEEGNLNGVVATRTRQNNNGGRSGFECPEERDYYPYWHPTPWRDIAVLVTDTSRCKFYEDQSQNVKNKGNCSDPAYNNKGDCESEGAEWDSTGKWGVGSPVCIKAEWNRDNHLGNSGTTGRTNQYNWTIPDDTNENCVLRLRYNITTDDYDAWVGGVDSTSNAKKSPVTQDPYVVVSGKNLSLALNTNQYGRTFQDRSHVFSIEDRPGKTGDVLRIFNLNVRGKRGNIVQSYPATEYDYVPETLFVRKDDYIHFQWTGCDNNPQNYAGEGTRGTDRSNIVEISSDGKNLPKGNGLFSGDTQFKNAHLNQPEEVCLSNEALLAKNNNDQDDADRDVQNCMKLNAAPQYHDGGTQKMKSTGEYNYMSSRNNNYTNRSQKGVITVVPLLPIWAIVLMSLGGAFFLGSGGLTGASVYAKANPGTPIANVLNKW